MVEITQEFLDKNANVPVAEIKQDIAETEAEIFKMERELPAHKILADGGDRMSYMRYRANSEGIESRKRFIFQLNALLAALADSSSNDASNK